MINKYNTEIECQMLSQFERLGEKEQRLYAALESRKLGYGGQSYISNLFGITRYRILVGVKELANPELLADIPAGKQRRLGGGRKKKDVSEPDLAEVLRSFIERHKAGSPTDETVYWIHLKPREIAAAFASESGHKVSHGFVKRVLQSLGYKYRKLRKDLATGTYAQRDEQFKIIFRLIGLMSLKTPVLSMDCKKKERLGHLYREGKLLSTASVKVFDHDYNHLSEGKVIPHGIYDLQRNEVYVTIGTSHETTLPPKVRTAN